jgi:O-antigen/teichoic acid export membrane protein
MKPIARLWRYLGSTDGSLKDKVLRSGVWQISISLTTNSLTFVRSIILARLLTPEAFGLMGLTLIVFRGIETMTTPGFGPALVQRKGRFEEAAGTAFTLLALRGVLLAIIMLPLSVVLADFFEHQSLRWMLVVTSISFLFVGLNNVNLIRRHRDLDFKSIAYLEQSVALVSFVTTIALAYWLRSEWALVFGFVVTACVKLILSYILVPGRPQFGFDKKIVRELFAYGKFITGANLLLYIGAELDSVVIGKVLGVEQLGYYTIAYLLANYPPTHVAYVASSVLFPAYSKLQDDKEALRRAIKRVLEFVGGVVLPVSAGMAVCAYEVITVLYGEKWTPAYIPFAVLCLFGGVHSLVAVTGYLFNGIGRPDQSFRIAIWRLAMIGVLIMPFTYSYGLTGTAVAVAIPMLMALILSFQYASQVLDLPVRTLYRAIAMPVLKAAVVALVLGLLRQHPSVEGLGGFALLVATGAVLYGLMNGRMILDVLRRR